MKIVHLLKTSRYFLSKLLLAAILVSIFVPFSPAMPADGLDFSWVFALNAAHAAELVFGRDLVFSFGPYSAVYTKSYHPATDFLMLFGGAVVALGYFFSLAIIAGQKPAGHERFDWIYILALAVAFGCASISHDALLAYLPLLVAFALLGQWHQKPTPPDTLVKRHQIYWLLWIPIGLLPLIKSSLLPSCLASIVIVSTYCLLKRKWATALLPVAITASSLVIFWLVANQPTGALPLFFKNSLLVIAGYSSAMALPGNRGEIVAFVLVASICLFILLTQRQPQRLYRYLLLVLLSAYYFLMFKAAFVRHDGHALIGAGALLLTAILFPISLGFRTAIVQLSISIIAYIYIGSAYTDHSPKSLVTNIQRNLTSSSMGIYHRLTNPNWLTSRYENAVTRIANTYPLPELPGTSDIYAYQQSRLLASANNWNPRPGLQSYAAYTESLSRLDRSHLAGSTAPDNIFFRVETIDRRFPPQDSGSSWPLILQRYRPAGVYGEYVHLSLNDATSSEVSTLPLGNYGCRLGQRIPVPRTELPLYVKFDFHKTLIGHLSETLFKISPLLIVVDTLSGERHIFRLVAGLAKAGFVLSPMVLNTNDFLGLATGEKPPESRSVTAITVLPYGWSGFWKEECAIAFEALQK